MKVKEISIGRGRKYSQNYQSVDYYVGITIEGTTVKDTVEDMIKRAVSELASLEIGEQSRCRNVIDIIGLEEDREFKEAVNNTTKTISNARIAIAKDKEDKQFNKETLIVEELIYIDNLKDVIVVKESDSELAYNIMKDGYETWIAKSHIDVDTLPLPFGVLLPEIHLKDDHKWILGKDNKGEPKTEWRKVGGFKT